MKNLILALVTLFTVTGQATEYSKTKAVQCSYNLDEYANNQIPSIELPQMKIEIGMIGGATLAGHFEAVETEVKPGIFIEIRGLVNGNGHKWVKKGNSLILFGELYRKIDGRRFLIDMESNDSNIVSTPKELEAAKKQVASSISLQDLTYKNMSERDEVVPKDLLVRVGIGCELVSIK